MRQEFDTIEDLLSKVHDQLLQRKEEIERDILDCETALQAVKDRMKPHLALCTAVLHGFTEGVYYPYKNITLDSVEYIELKKDDGSLLCIRHDLVSLHFDLVSDIKNDGRNKTQIVVAEMVDENNLHSYLHANGSV